jgi:hypothetical protein
MKSLAARVALITLGIMLAGPVSSQEKPSAPAGTRTDVYHVHLTKAVPGQAAALGKALMVPVPDTPMPDHLVVLRHQEGDSWDYAVIQHMGQKVEVDATPTAPGAASDLRAWHDDTLTAGPGWDEFAKAMGIGGTAGASGMVYTLGFHRAVPGHRAQLEKILMSPPPSNSKVQTGNVLLQHLEGGDWTFLAITRYNSWQDFGNDRGQAAADPDAPGGWAEIRQHSDMHRDTIADRMSPAK